MLEIKNVHKSFNARTVNETEVFDGFSLSVERGEFVSVVGSNGSGKTTLLNLISGSVDPDEGKIVLNGRELSALPEHKRARYAGRVFQDPAAGTVPGMTIAENLAIADNKGNRYGLSAGLNKKRLSAYRGMLAELGLGLEDKMGMEVGALSGGQRQALALVMCSMSDIELLLLDEHTAALDPKTSQVIMTLTDKIIKQKGVTTVMVTHNLKYAVEYGSRLLMLDKGQVVLDKRGEDKVNTKVEDILSIFNKISVECGN